MDFWKFALNWKLIEAVKIMQIFTFDYSFRDWKFNLKIRLQVEWIDFFTIWVEGLKSYICVSRESKDFD